MLLDTETMVGMAEANQNFSKVARLVDEKGVVVIMRNNKPKYIIRDIYRENENTVVSNERLFSVAKEIISRDRDAFMELAK